MITCHHSHFSRLQESRCSLRLHLKALPVFSVIKLELWLFSTEMCTKLSKICIAHNNFRRPQMYLTPSRKTSVNPQCWSFSPIKQNSCFFFFLLYIGQSSGFFTVFAQTQYVETVISAATAGFFPK